jgi:hypothetical protein
MLDNLFSPVHLIVLAFALGIYLLPTIISIRRRHPDRVLIAIFNIFFGGTVVGWIIALIWALNAQIAISLLPAQPAKEP